MWKLVLVAVLAIPAFGQFNSYRYVAGSKLSNFPDVQDPGQAEPERNACVQDPSWFSPSVCKVTDVAAEWNPVNRKVFVEKVPVSRWTVENSDGTLFYTQLSGDLPQGSGEGQIAIYRTADNSLYAHPALNTNEGREFRWSDTDPKLMYYIPLGTCRLTAYNIDIGKTTVIHDFSNEYATCTTIGNDTEGTSSIGNRYWAFMVQGPRRFGNTKLLAIIVYDLKTDSIIGELNEAKFVAQGGTAMRWNTYGGGGRPNAVDISPSGDRVLATWPYVAYPTGQNFQISAAKATVSSGLMTVYSVRPPQTFFEVGDEVQFRLVSGSASAASCSGAAADALVSHYPIDSFVDDHTMIVDVSASGLKNGSYSCSYMNPAIVSVAVSGGTATVTFGSKHFLEVGRSITLYGTPNGTLNATAAITGVPSDRTATFKTAAGAGTYTTDLMYYRDPKNGVGLPDTNTSFTSYRPNTNADDGAHVYNLDFTNPVRVMNGETHSGWAWALNGDPVLIHQTNSANWSGAEVDTFGFTNIYTGVYTPMLKHADVGFEPMSLHHSRFYDDSIRGWGMFSFSSPTTAKSKLRGQFVLVELAHYDAHPEIWRVGYLHTDLGCGTMSADRKAAISTCNYHSEAQLSVDRDGLGYRWGTAWPNGSGSINTYHADIPLRVKSKGSFRLVRASKTGATVSFIAPTVDSACTITTSVKADFSDPVEAELAATGSAQRRLIEIGAAGTLSPETKYYSKITCRWNPIDPSAVSQEEILGSFTTIGDVVVFRGRSRKP